MYITRQQWFPYMHQVKCIGWDRLLASSFVQSSLKGNGMNELEFDMYLFFETRYIVQGP